MKNNFCKKAFVMVIFILFICMSCFPLTTGIVKNSYKKALCNSFSEKGDTEYWALIFAVGVYKNAWDEDRPIMIKNANYLYEVLINSCNWQVDHIHKVTAEEATGRRLIKELIWLILNEDSNDMSLVYLTTHGSPLKDPKGNFIDLPPKDEEDGADEMLVMYDGFDKWYAFIWDDLLNFFLSLLQSKGVCLIVDSCYAGGFNDSPMFTGNRFKNYSAESFKQGMVEELSAQNRIVLMACKEDEECYGPYFSDYLIDGFGGAGDFWGNNDGINSAEESFRYAEYWVNKLCSFTPTILDLFPGEYPVTYSETFN